METPPKITGWDLIMEAIVKYGLLVSLVLFSVLAKAFSMYKYRKRMTTAQCIFETLLCGFGGSIVTYVVWRMNAPIWILCGVGGFGSLAITPLTTVITKEAEPTLMIAVRGVQKFINNYVKKNN